MLNQAELDQLLFNHFTEPGSRRERIATAAMQGMLANPNYDSKYVCDSVRESYAIADAMIAHGASTTTTTEGERS